MIRALYTAASGMNAQQANIDNVAHNLANVNTTGFKKSRVEFEDLVYQQIKAPGAPTSQEGEAPIGLEAGLGSRAVATARNFTRRQPAQHRRAARHRDRRAGLLPGLAARRRDRLHARRHVPRERPGPARDRRGLPARAGDHDSRQRDVGHRSRRTASCRRSTPGQPTAAGGHDRAGAVPEPGRPRAARRQHLRGDDRLRRSDDRRRPAPTGSARSRRASSKTRTSASSRRW